MTLTENDLHASEIIYTCPAKIPHIAEKHGKLLFSAYGCSLMERKTDSGTYVYTAVDLAIGKAEILSRRKLQLSEDRYPDMAKKISASPIRGDSRFTIDKKPGDRPDSARLTETARRIFTDILPLHGYTLREKQLELAEHILDVIGRRGISLAESEVGTGKTHAYLIAALLAKRGRLNDFWLRGHYPRQSWAESAHMPVVISTSSIALQNAIVTDYIPELSRILLQHGIIRTPLTAVIRKGKEHFICEKRLHRYYDNADERTRALLAPYMGSCAPFDLIGADTLTPHMKRGVCVSGGKCAASCSHAHRCRYFKHLKEINDPTVDFQITNHNYFIADTLHRTGGRRSLLPHYQMVLIDEAHKFLDAARSMYGLELTDTELPALAQEVHAFTSEKSFGGVNVHRLAKKLEEQSAKLFQRLNANIPASDEKDDAERFPAIFDSETTRHLKSIAGIAADIAEACADSYVQPSHKDRKSKTLWRLGMAAERVSALRAQGNLVCWLEKRMEGETATDALCAIPKDLNARLHCDLWNQGIPIILTSGTLSASGDFTRTKETLGLNHVPERLLSGTSMPSPFDYKNNALLYISSAVPFPDQQDKRYLAAVADEVGRLILASHGHAAVLFTSYNAMGQVFAMLKERNLSYPMFQMGRRDTGALEKFKARGNGILFASGSLWEGIDIPGDTLSMLVIVKLPFAAPDPISDYEQGLYGDMNAYKARVLVPEMLIKLKQGFGRLIRTETDTGVCAILDSRVREGAAYHDRVLAALPPCRITPSVEAVWQFLSDRKPAAYFK
jgi:ATP-dependent DNA helicase DinG